MSPIVWHAEWTQALEEILSMQGSGPLHARLWVMRTMNTSWRLATSMQNLVLCDTPYGKARFTR